MLKNDNFKDLLEYWSKLKWFKGESSTFFFFLTRNTTVCVCFNVNPFSFRCNHKS